MAKQGQHENDARDSRKSRGHNNPSKSMTITTGSYKKRETYEQQARGGEETDPQPQADRNEWREDTRDPRRLAMRATKTSTRARQGDLDSGRSGSKSNAGSRKRAK